MTPTNVKTVHQTSLLHTEGNLNRLGLLSPTHDLRSQHIKADKLRSNPFYQQVQVSQDNTLYRNNEIEILRSMVVEALSW